MQEVLLVAEIEPIEELLHKGGYVFLAEVTESRVQQTHEVMIHVLKHQVEGPLVFAEVNGILLVRTDLHELHHVVVVELAEDLDFTDGRDGEAFFLILQTHFFQSHECTWNNSSRYKYQEILIPRLFPQVTENTVKSLI